MADASAFLESNVFGGSNFGPYVRMELNKNVRVHALLGEGENPLRVFIHRMIYPKPMTDPDTQEQITTDGYAESVCIGKIQGCVLCQKNAEAVAEAGKPLANTDKPFPLTPRWLMNVWNFETKRVEVLKGGKSIFDQIAKIYETLESLEDVDLIVGKSGSGGRNDTNYSAVNTQAQPIDVPKQKMLPYDVIKLANELIIVPEQIEDMLAGKGSSFNPKELDEGDANEGESKALPAGDKNIQTIGAEPSASDSSDGSLVEEARKFKMTAGTHKGKTLGAVVDIDPKFLGIAIQSRNKKLAQAATILMDASGGGKKDSVPPSAPKGDDENAKLIAEINEAFENNKKYRNFSLILKAFRDVTKTDKNPKGKVDLVDFTTEELKKVLKNLKADA